MKRKIHPKNFLGIALILFLLFGCRSQGTTTSYDTPAGTPAPATAKPLPPTQTPAPPTPTTVSSAGKTFHGPLGDGGEITFTVSADGLALDPGTILALKDVSCAEGGSSSSFSKVSMEITLPKNISIPIEDMKFKYGSDNMFEPGYGFEFLGQFDSAILASGTFKYTDTDQPLETCTYGPYQWTASTP